MNNTTSVQQQKLISFGNRRKLKLDFATYGTGIYFAKIVGGDYSTTQRFIIE